MNSQVKRKCNGLKQIIFTHPFGFLDKYYLFVVAILEYIMS